MTEDNNGCKCNRKPDTNICPECGCKTKKGEMLDKIDKLIEEIATMRTNDGYVTVGIDYDN